MVCTLSVGATHGNDCFRIRLLDILVNLVANAYKFTESGYIRVIVALDEEDRTKLRLSVSHCVQV